MASRTEHWLVKVAQRAQLYGADTLTLPSSTPAAEAWQTVARSCDVSEEDLAPHVAAYFKLKMADLDGRDTRALRLVPEAPARRFGVLPLHENDRHIIIASSDPTDLSAEQAIGFASGRSPMVEIASPAVLRDAIDHAYGGADRAVEKLLSSVDTEVTDAVRVMEDFAPEAIAARELDSAPVVKLTNLILRDAVAQRSSDIHIEPGRTKGVVRFRVDGVLRTAMELPLGALTRVVSRLKVLAKLDISDRLRPQDGRARAQVLGKTLELRLSTVPTREAEKAVVRILDPETSHTLDDLKIGATDLTRIRHLFAQKNGIVVVTGPTGSGKTTTLYAGLRELANGEVNISTVEDPIEYELAGTTQIQVNPKRGVTFSSALRALLRQDPDVILVGEMRDLETASVAVQASMTGHLVLATLHTNDAVGVIARLMDIGLERSAVASSLRGVMAQRLVRRVCPDCVQPVVEPRAEERRLASRYGVKPVVRAVGCKKCGETGYKGRLAIIEVVVKTPALEDLINKEATAADLQRAAVTAGSRTLRDSAIDRVKDGETTLEEVERVLGAMEEEPEAAAPVGPAALVVDDDPVNRMLARTLLEKSGFRVTEAGDGVAAMERLERDSDFALMLLDLEMPRMGGREVLERVRANPATAALPVIVLTGAADAGLEVELMDAGADDYLRKPLDPPRFVARVKGALRRAKG